MDLISYVTAEVLTAYLDSRSGERPAGLGGPGGRALPLDATVTANP